LGIVQLKSLEDFLAGQFPSKAFGAAANLSQE